MHRASKADRLNWKRVLTLLLAVVLAVSVWNGALPQAQAAPTILDTLKEADIYNGDYKMSYLAMNGAVQSQAYTYYNYITLDGTVKEIPAYCVSPDKYGVPQTVAPGESIHYIIDSVMADPKAVGIICNGYPHQSLATLGLDNKHQAFYATKMALWSYIIPSWSLSNLTVNPSLTGTEKTIAERLLAAAQKIYINGTQWDAIPQPALTATPETATARKVTIDGVEYLEQVFAAHSETWVNGLKIRIGFALPDDAAALGAKIVNMDNQAITELEMEVTHNPTSSTGSYDGKYKVLVPAANADQITNALEVNLTGKVYKYELVFAICGQKDEYGNLQNYLLDTDPVTDMEVKAVFTVPTSETPPPTPTPTPTPGIPTPTPTIPTATSLRIIKKEAGTTTPLEGAVYEIVAPDGTHLGSYSSGADGTITVPLTQIGNYTITEITPPRYHLLPEQRTQHVNVVYGKTAEVTFVNEPYGDLRIEKIDSATGGGLAGARIQIKHIESGTVYTQETGPGGAAQFTQLKPGAYEIVELAAPAGWIKDPQIHTTTVVSGECVTYTLKNDARPSLKIIKFDRESHTTMSGVVFEIFRDGEFLGNYETDALGEITLPDAQPGTYTVAEVDSGDSGHIIDNRMQEIELTAGDGVKTLYFFNDRKPSIRLTKVDSSDPGKTIPGAVFEIRSVVGDYGPEEFTTDENGEIDLSELPVGAYVIKEKSCNGYVIDEAERIVHLAPSMDMELVFTNSKKPTLHLVKVSADGTPLAGVTFRIAYVEDGTHYLDRTTDANGEIFVEDLEPGVLSVKETATPPDHILDPTEHHVELFPGRTPEIRLTNNKRPTLTIMKKDADTGEPVPNTVFIVKEVDGSAKKEITTGADGKAVLENILLPGKYEISEKSVPAAYLMDAEPQIVTLEPNQSREVLFENHKKPTLTIFKVDSITGAPIQGAKFEVWYGSNNTTTGELNKLGTYTSDKNGQIVLDKLRDGWYKVTELEPVAGYTIKQPDTQEVFIKGGENKEITFENVPLSALIVWKYDSVSGLAVEGAVFQIRYLGGTSGTGGTAIGTYTTGPNGSFSVTGLVEGNYIVEELASDSGHVIDSAPQTVYISGKEQDVVQVYFGNSPKGAVLIKKIDDVTHEPLSGVEFLVATSEGVVVGNANGKYVTDSAGTILIENLDPSMTLVVKEVRAKDGYLLDDAPQTVKVKSGETVTLEFRNQPKGALLIRKVCSVNPSVTLANAEFKVTYADGTLIGDSNGVYRTDENGEIRISGLTPGKSVVVTETKAPAGFLIDTQSQTVLINEGRTASLTFKNQPKGQLIIQKRDSLTGEVLPGAEFRITTAAGCEVGLDGVIGTSTLTQNGIFTTDAQGEIHITNLAPGAYVLTEIKAPNGYVIDTPSTNVVVGANGDTQTVIIKNSRQGTLIINKKDSVTGKPLEGVEFKVTTSSGEVVADKGGQISSNGVYFTNQDGQIIISGLKPDTYVVTETATIEGYIIHEATCSQTVVVNSNDTQSLFFYNDPTATLLIHKYVEGTKNEPLAGVQFKVVDGSGAAVGPNDGIYYTDKQGDITINGLAPGMTVKAWETKTLEGYVLDGTPQDIKITGGVQELTFWNQRAGTIVIRKLDKSNGKPLAGVEFELTYADGRYVDDANGHLSSKGLYATDAKGEIRISGITGTIVIKEVKTIPGYTIDPATQIQTVTVNPEDTQVLTFYNVPGTTLTIQKYVDGTTDPIQGATFLITDGYGTLLGPSNGEFTTNRNGRIILEGLTPGTTIIAKEVRAADGYVLDTTPQSILIREGEAQTMTFFNKVEGGLELIKVSESDKSHRIPNTTFEIRKLDGGVVKTVTTDSRGRVYTALDAGNYYAVEVEAAEGFKLDNTPHHFAVKDGETTTLTVTNKPFCGILIHKTDAMTGRGISGATFLLYNSGMTPIGQYTSDNTGNVYIEDLTVPGRYYLRELSNAGYIVDTEMKTVYVTAGETTLVEWKNLPITGQIQITKRSADYNPTNGLPARTLLEGAVFEIYDKANNLVDTIKSDSRGLAVSRQLPLDRYTIREAKAPDNYGVNDTVLNAYLEYAGQIARFEVADKSLVTGVSISKTGPKEVMAGQPVRYQFSGIANTSNVRLDSFYWRDTLPGQVRLESVVTGTYNFPSTYKIVYCVNGKEYRALADNLSTSKNYTLAASPTALGLAANERVTEVMFVFGQVPAGFAQVEAPGIHCTAVSGLAANSSFVSFVNMADVGGVYNSRWIQAVSRWVTTVYGKPTPLPRTGY